MTAVDYTIENLPLNDDLLKNAEFIFQSGVNEFVYFPKRGQSTISQVVYFVSRLVLKNCCVHRVTCSAHMKNFCYTRLIKIWEETLVKEDKDKDVRKYSEEH